MPSRPRRPVAKEPTPAQASHAVLGYARVSTGHQVLDQQLDALAAAGVDGRVFTDTMSGTRDDRPGLAELIMTDEPNGLASMTQARERRARRTMPPPRHPVPVDAREPADAETVSSGLENEQPAQPAPGMKVEQPESTRRPLSGAPLPAPIDVQTTKGTENTAGEGSGPSRPATLYLDEAHVDFLEEARMSGLVSRPRLDISKSAVVRLALRRLQQEMTINEIRDYLKAQPIDPAKIGRKRR